MGNYFKKFGLEGKENAVENSLAVQWLGLRTLTAKGLGSIPGEGTKIPHAAGRGQKINRVGLKKKKSLIFLNVGET